jgi:hypothetical protein
MKSLLASLGAFVAGVFVGAGQWFALFLCAAGLVAWWMHRTDPDSRSLKHIENLGPRPRDKGR